MAARILDLVPLLKDFITGAADALDELLEAEPRNRSEIDSGAGADVI
jgi:hypothetical protein